MTRAEFYEKYGDVKFVSYYKYIFCYQAHLTNGNKLECEYGGCSDAIYRHDVDADSEQRVYDLTPFSGRVYENDVIIDEFYDY